MRKAASNAIIAISTISAIIGLVELAEIIGRCFRPNATNSAEILNSLKLVEDKLKHFRHEIARLKLVEAELKHQGEAISQLLEAVGWKG
jgi:hypothetical protein